MSLPIDREDSAPSDREVDEIVARGETPTCSRSAISLISQLPSPASRFEVSEGAYQFWFGIIPPSNALDSLEPPSALMAV